MTKNLFRILVLTLFLGSTLANAQRKADKTVAFEGKIEEMFFHEFSAVPIILTDKTVAGVDPASGARIWEVQGNRLSVLGGAIQSDEGNYETVPFSPYIIVGDLLIDTRNGKLLLDKEKNGYKKIKSFQIIPELQAYVFQCTTDDKSKNKIYLVSLSTDESKWEVDIPVAKRGALDNIVVAGNGNIAFTIGANLLMLNADTGNVVLNENEKIGKLFFNPNRDVMYAVEAAGGGLGSMLGAAMTMNLNKLVALGEKVHAFNTADGSRAWKKPLKLDEGFMFSLDVDGKMFIQHEKAGNLYDYATGEKLWKRDFEKKRTNEVEKVDEGYMVYYGARKMLLDDTGKQQWKKPQYNGNEFLADVGEDDTYDEFGYAKGSIIATSYRIAYYEDGVKKPIWKFAVDEDTRIAYDEETKTVIVLDGKKLYLLNPDKGWNKENSQKLELKKHRDFNMMEVRGDNYFLSSPYEFAIVSKDGEVKKTQYYVQPGEAGRKWLNAASALGTVAGAGLQATGGYNTMVGGTSGVAKMGGINAPGTGGFKQAKKGVNQVYAGHYTKMASTALYNPNRVNAFKDSRDHAFYFTKSGDDVKYLVQVTKDDGEELDKFTFLDNNPQYHVDEVEKRVFYTKGKELYIFDYK